MNTFSTSLTKRTTTGTFSSLYGSGRARARARASSLDTQNGNVAGSDTPPRPKILQIKNILDDIGDSDDGALPCAPELLDSDRDMPSRPAGDETLENDTRELIGTFLTDFTGLSTSWWGQGKTLSTMKRVVDDLLRKHRYGYHGMRNKIMELDNGGDDMSFIMSVAKGLFGDGVTNWGRIASLVAFGAVVCQYLKEMGRQHCVALVGQEISTYLLSDQRDWLVKNNSWDGFVEFFRVADPESTVRHALMAVAGFAGIVATLALLIRVCCLPPCCPHGRHSTRAHPVPACCSADRPQILQPSSPCLSEHLHQERLVKTLPTEGHSDPPRWSRGGGTAHADSGPSSGSPIADVSGPTRPLAPDPDELSVLLSIQLRLHDHLGSGAPQEGSARGIPVPAAQSGSELQWRAPTEIPRDSGSPGSVGSAQPRVLQAPCLHKRVSVPALPQGGTGGFARLRGSSGLLANLRTKQLPPPSRGLPCFNTGPQAQAPCLSRASLPLLHTSLGLRGDPVATAVASLEEPDTGKLRTRVPVPPSLSRLPKPKIH